MPYPTEMCDGTVHSPEMTRLFVVKTGIVQKDADAMGLQWTAKTMLNVPPYIQSHCIFKQTKSKM